MYMECWHNQNLVGGDYDHVSEHNHVKFATFPGHIIPILQLTTSNDCGSPHLTEGNCNRQKAL
jgi:hypothetical protein